MAVTAEAPNDAEGRGWESRGVVRGVDSGRARVRAFPRARSSRRAAARRGGGRRAGRGAPEPDAPLGGRPGSEEEETERWELSRKKKKMLLLLF